jgi:hypothetical protein
MSIKRLDELPEGSGFLTSDDIFLFMDDPSGSGVTKKISLSEISSSIGGGGLSFAICPMGSGSGNLPTDATSCSILTATCLGDTLIENPTWSGVPIDGKSIRWKISQDEAGGHAITLDTKFNIPSSATSPLPWSTDPNTTDLLAATYDAIRDEWDVIAFVPGY